MRSIPLVRDRTPNDLASLYKRHHQVLAIRFVSFTTMPATGTHKRGFISACSRNSIPTLRTVGHLGASSTDWTDGLTETGSPLSSHLRAANQREILQCSGLHGRAACQCNTQTDDEPDSHNALLWQMVQSHQEMAAFYPARLRKIMSQAGF